MKLLKNLKHNKYDGYIALVSVIIVSAIGSILVTSLMMVSISSLGNTKANREYEAAYFAAEACAEHALMELAKDNGYSAGENLVFATADCDVVSLTGSGSSDRVINVEGTSGESVVRLSVDVASLNPEVSINSWVEVLDF